MLVMHWSDDLGDDMGITRFYQVWQMLITHWPNNPSNGVGMTSFHQADDKVIRLTIRQSA
jgi:hypothetical protein